MKKQARICRLPYNVVLSLSTEGRQNTWGHRGRVKFKCLVENVTFRNNFFPSTSFQKLVSPNICPNAPGNKHNSKIMNDVKTKFL